MLDLEETLECDVDVVGRRPDEDWARTERLLEGASAWSSSSASEAHDDWGFELGGLVSLLLPP